MVQELTPPPDDSAAGRTRAAVDGLLADTRGLLPSRSAEELAEELGANGFEKVEVVSSPIGRLVLGRR